MGRVCKVWSLGICLVCENPSRMPCGIACPGDCACQGVFGGTRTHNRRLRRPLRYHCATKTCLESELAAWPALVFAAEKVGKRGPGGWRSPFKSRSCEYDQMVRMAGLEPATPGSQNQRSSTELHPCQILCATGASRTRASTGKGCTGTSATAVC